MGPGDPPQDLVDHIMAVRRLEELTGAGRYDLGRLLPLLDDELPPEEECVQGCIGRIKALVEAGSWDLALRWSDLLMAFRPRSADALYGRIAAYEGKGLHMMATAEAETLVELLPEDLTAHRRLRAVQGRGWSPTTTARSDGSRRSWTPGVAHDRALETEISFLMMTVDGSMRLGVFRSVPGR